MFMENINQKQRVILIHGMGRSKFSLLGIGNFLKKHNFEVISYSYSSTKYSISELSAQFADFLKETSLCKIDNSDAPINYTAPEDKVLNPLVGPLVGINILSHSLGGIISREAVDSLKDSGINFGCLIMLAPPNGGSKAANIGSKIWPIPNILKPITELQNCKESAIHKIPIPDNIDIGVIAGKYDKKVSIAESHIKNEKDHLVINASHTFIMNHKKTKEAVLNFLSYSKF